MPVVELATAAVTKAGLNQLVESCSALAKAPIARRLKTWKAQKNISKVYTSIKQVRMVKTIWQTQKAVDLARFYCPMPVKFNGVRQPAHSVAEFGDEHHVVIEGTVGQGKSISLRYLTAREASRGQWLPMFVELRRIGSNESLREFLIAEIESYGLDCDDEIFDFLASKGKLCLLLDGFDEVRENDRQKVINDVERLCRRFEKIRTIISTRPDSEISRSPYFRVVRLDALQGREYEPVLRRISHSKELAEGIIAELETDPGDITGLLTTPLMIALLVVRYDATQSMPDNRTAFFSELFSLVLTRHDRSKAGYIRPRNSRLSDSELRIVFDSVCFRSRKARHVVAQEDVFDLQIKAALLQSGIDARTDDVLKDFIQITCLVAEDSGQHDFIHISIAEYHAASFVKNQPERWALRFYEGLFNRWREWQGEISFLESMDHYRYLKYFAIPDMKKGLGLRGSTPRNWRTTESRVNRGIGQREFGIDQEGRLLVWQPTERLCLASEAREETVWQALSDQLQAMKTEGQEPAFYRTSKTQKSDWTRLSSVLDDPQVGSSVRAAIDEVLVEIHNDLQVAEAYIEQADDLSYLTNF